MTKPNGFIRIERSLWRDPRVTDLSIYAQLILVELHYRHTGKNNGKLCLSYNEASSRLRCSKSTVVRAFAELHQAGLVETVVSGSFDNKQGARKGIGSQYRLNGAKEI